MKIIPYEIYILKTQLTEEEVKIRLQENIETGNYFKRHITGDKIYEGGIIKDYFEIKMITAGSFPFKAIVGGKILREQEGTIIKIKLRMQETGIAFSFVIIAMFIVSLCFLVNGLINHTLTGDKEIAVIIFFVFIIAILCLYNLHTQYIKQNLKVIFEAAEVKYNN